MRNFVTVTASDENGQQLHRTLIDLDQDVNAQLTAFVQYIAPRLKPAPGVTDDDQAFALEAAVTAYRLCLAAEAVRKNQVETRLSALKDQEKAERAQAAAILSKWAEEGQQIKARVQARTGMRTVPRPQPPTDLYGPPPRNAVVSDAERDAVLNAHFADRAAIDAQRQDEDPAAWLKAEPTAWMGATDSPEVAAERARIQAERDAEHPIKCAQDEAQDRANLAARVIDPDDDPDDDRPGSAYKEDWFPS